MQTGILSEVHIWLSVWHSRGDPVAQQTAMRSCAARQGACPSTFSLNVVFN